MPRRAFSPPSTRSARSSRQLCARETSRSARGSRRRLVGTGSPLRRRPASTVGRVVRLRAPATSCRRRRRFAAAGAVARALVPRAGLRSSRASRSTPTSSTASALRESTACVGHEHHVHRAGQRRPHPRGSRSRAGTEPAPVWTSARCGRRLYARGRSPRAALRSTITRCPRTRGGGDVGVDRERETNASPAPRHQCSVQRPQRREPAPPAARSRGCRSRTALAELSSRPAGRTGRAGRPRRRTEHGASERSSRRIAPSMNAPTVLGARNPAAACLRPSPGG